MSARPESFLTRRAFVAGALGAAAASLTAEEKTPPEASAIVFNLEKLATHDGPGLRTVAFLKGCPLRCRWCHSPESWSYAIERYPNGETIGKRMSVSELLREVLKDRDFYEESKGGVTLSGGEPLAQPDFAAQFLAAAKRERLHTAVETSGFAPSAVIDRLLPFVDLWLYDIKLMDEAACLQYTSRPLRPVLDNLRRINAALLKAKRGAIVLRCPMIPGINDSEAELLARARLADELDAVIRLDIEPYVPYGIDKALRLGLKVYEAPQPPASYGPAKVSALQRLTPKPITLG